jgi:hypothetical protein
MTRQFCIALATVLALSLSLPVMSQTRLTRSEARGD